MILFFFLTQRRHGAKKKRCAVASLRESHEKTAFFVDKIYSPV